MTIARVTLQGHYQCQEIAFRGNLNKEEIQIAVLAEIEESGIPPEVLLDDVHVEILYQDWED